MLSLFLFSTFSSFVSTHGKLHVEGRFVKDQNDQNVTLRGVALPSHADWPLLYSKNVIRQLAQDWKATVIRATIDIDEQEGYLADPDFAYECIHNVIRAAIEEGIYVIIDFYSEVEHDAQAHEFFAEMARSYNHTANVIYELFGGLNTNQPWWTSGWENLRDYYISLISEIRDFDQDNLIICRIQESTQYDGTWFWNPINALENDPLPPENAKNVLYGIYLSEGLQTWFEGEFDETVSDSLPMFVSEAAGDSDNSNVFQREEWEYWVDFFLRTKIGWTAAFLTKDRHNGMLSRNTTERDNWTIYELTDWGKEVRRLLRCENAGLCGDETPTPTENFNLSSIYEPSASYNLSSSFNSSQLLEVSAPLSNSYDFSQTELLSNSLEPSFSNQLSDSNSLSESQILSDSDQLSLSNLISDSQVLSASNQISLSNLISDSNQLSFSKDLSNSDQLSKTSLLSNSNQLSTSDVLSQSSPKTTFVLVTETNSFSESKAISSSNWFSQSTSFSISNGVSSGIGSLTTNPVSTGVSTGYSKAFSPSFSGSLSQPENYSNSESEETTSPGGGGNPANNAENNKTSWNKWMIIAIVLGVVLIIVLIIFIVYYTRTKKDTKSQSELNQTLLEHGDSNL